MPTLDRPGGSLNYIIEGPHGAPATVVLIHGLCCELADWSAQEAGEAAVTAALPGSKRVSTFTPTAQMSLRCSRRCRSSKPCSSGTVWGVAWFSKPLPGRPGVSVVWCWLTAAGSSTSDAVRLIHPDLSTNLLILMGIVGAKGLRPRY